MSRRKPNARQPCAVRRGRTDPIDDSFFDCKGFGATGIQLAIRNIKCHVSISKWLKYSRKEIRIAGGSVGSWQEHNYSGRFSMFRKALGTNRPFKAENPASGHATFRRQSRNASDCGESFCGTFPVVRSRPVSLERSHELKLSRQFETSRWRLVTATASDYVRVSLERSQEAQPFLRTDKFCARSDDWAITRSGHRVMQAICVPRYLRRRVLLFGRPAIR
jgi:hypothetical protein